MHGAYERAGRPRIAAHINVADGAARRVLTIASLIVLAALPRLWALGSDPPGLHPDELAGLVGVRAEFARQLPLLAFFDLRVVYLPLFGLVESLSAALFGDGAFALRLPAALGGIATVFTLQAFVWALLRDRTIAFIAAAIIAIVPWDIEVSRVAWEPAIALPFLLGGLALLETGLRSGMRRRIVAAFVVLALGAYTYRAELLDAVLLGGVLVVSSGARLRGLIAPLRAGIVWFFVVLLPLAVSIAVHPKFFRRDRAISTFAGGITPHNIATFAHNYAAHFDPRALFITGDGDPTQGPAVGVLFWWMLPCMLAGLWFARSQTPRVRFVIACWLLLYPLGGALTNYTVPHFLRAIAGAPLACLLAAIGIVGAWRALSALRIAPAARPVFASILGLTIALEFAVFSDVYFVRYPATAADAFGIVNTRLFTRLRALEPGYPRICFDSLNYSNAPTLIDYYLTLHHVQPKIFERLETACARPGTILALNVTQPLPRGARTIALVRDAEGRPAIRLAIVPARHRLR